MTQFNRPTSRKRSPKAKRPWRVEHRRIDIDPEAKWSAFLPAGGCRTFADRGPAINACQEEAHTNQVDDKIFRNTRGAHRRWRVRNKQTGEIAFEFDAKPKES